MDCLKENAENILKFYEGDIIEHVLESQMNNKVLRSLIIRSYQKEKEDPNKYSGVISARLARSSLYGQNPFGDEPLDPSPSLSEPVSEPEDDEGDWSP